MTDRRAGVRGGEPVTLDGRPPKVSFPLCRAPGPLSGGELPAVGVAEAEGEEPSEVDGGGTVGQPQPVAGETAVGDASAGAHEPGEAAFDHGPPASVVVGEVAVAPGPAGIDEFGVVGMDMQGPAVTGGGAACSE